MTLLLRLQAHWTRLIARHATVASPNARSSEMIGEIIGRAVGGMSPRRRITVETLFAGLISSSIVARPKLKGQIGGAWLDNANAK